MTAGRWLALGGVAFAALVVAAVAVALARPAREATYPAGSPEAVVQAAVVTSDSVAAAARNLDGSFILLPFTQTIRPKRDDAGDCSGCALIPPG